MDPREDPKWVLHNFDKRPPPKTDNERLQATLDIVTVILILVLIPFISVLAAFGAAEPWHKTDCSSLDD